LIANLDMSDAAQHHDLDEIPDESTIVSLREQAEAEAVSVEARFPTDDGEQKRLVVSPRGTVVLLNDVSEETFNRSLSAAEIATALRE
jgi:hypothetical protein